MPHQRAAQTAQARTGARNGSPERRVASAVATITINRSQQTFSLPAGDDPNRAITDFTAPAPRPQTDTPWSRRDDAHTASCAQPHAGRQGTAGRSPAAEAPFATSPGEGFRCGTKQR
ncbi:MAG: hypothetical protein NVSMB23_07780 [Myxococcales bacterium]